MGSAAAERALWVMWGARPPVTGAGGATATAAAAVVASADAAAAAQAAPPTARRVLQSRGMRHDLSVASFFTSISEGGVVPFPQTPTAAAARSLHAGEGEGDFADSAAAIETWERDAAKVVCAQRALAALLELSVPQPSLVPTPTSQKMISKGLGSFGSFSTYGGHGSLQGPEGGIVDQALLDLLLAILRGGAWQLVSGAFLEAVLFHLQVR